MHMKMMSLTQFRFLWRAVTGVAAPNELSSLIGLKRMLRGGSSLKLLFSKKFLGAENSFFWICTTG